MNDTDFKLQVIERLVRIEEGMKVVSEHSETLKSMTCILNKVKGGWIVLAACSSVTGFIGGLIFSLIKYLNK